MVSRPQRKGQLSPLFRSFRTEAQSPRSGLCNEVSGLDHQMPRCDESPEAVPHADMMAWVSAKCFRHFISVTKCYPGGTSICASALKMRVRNKLNLVRGWHQLRRQTNPLVAYDRNRVKDQIFAVGQQHGQYRDSGWLRSCENEDHFTCVWPAETGSTADIMRQISLWLPPIRDSRTPGGEEVDTDSGYLRLRASIRPSCGLRISRRAEKDAVRHIVLPVHAWRTVSLIALPTTGADVQELAAGHNTPDMLRHSFCKHR